MPVYKMLVVYTGGFTNDDERWTPSVDRNSLAWKLLRRNGKDQIW